MIRRYNVVFLRGGVYVNDPETMTIAAFDTVMAAERASRMLNRGQVGHDQFDWVS